MTSVFASMFNLQIESLTNDKWNLQCASDGEPEVSPCARKRPIS